LDAAGSLDRTLVVVAGDHGEGLMQHGHMFHGLHIYEEAVRVPLLFVWPRGLGGPRVVDAPVQLVDLMPTVLELAGCATPPLPAPARSLAGVLRGRVAADREREVFLQRRRYDEPLITGQVVRGNKYALRAGRWKYIEAREEGTYELYDLDRDAGEMQNLFGAPPMEAAALPRRLEQWVRTAPAVATPPQATGEDASRLRSLGYVQ
jgi:arylsulfatase A-like enzyme